MDIVVPGVRSYGSVADSRDASDKSETDAAKKAKESADGGLGKTAFLELMIAQIKNQDPLEPAKNEAFIAQLAQFSSVEGIQNLNESMDGLVSSMRAGLTMDAAALVGRNVLVPTKDTVLSDNGGISGTIAITEATTELNMEIRNSDGIVVKRFEYGPQVESDLRFAWDGISEAGTVSPQGLYTVSAYNNTGEDGARNEFGIDLPQTVVSVSIEEAGLVANLVGGISVPAAQIKEIQ